jgi:hypothetical protein
MLDLADKVGWVERPCWAVKLVAQLNWTGLIN